MGVDYYSLRGKREFGSSAALPIGVGFKRIALPPQDAEVEMPACVVRLRIDRESGERSDSQSTSMWEVFLEEFTPSNQRGRTNSADTEDLDGLF